MFKLSSDAKLELAVKYTDLAIQHDLIYKQSEEDTAKAICTFFKTIYNELDNTEE